MKLTIKKREDREGKQLTGSGYRFYLDELDVTDALQEVKLIMGIKEANISTVTFVIDDIDVDADALAALEVIVGSQEVDKPPAERQA